MQSYTGLTVQCLICAAILLKASTKQRCDRLGMSLSLA